MEFGKRMVEWYFGIPPSGPGEGTAWSFSAQPPVSPWVPPWMAILAGLGCIALVIYVVRRDAGHVSGVGKVLLTTTRLLAILLGVSLLSGLTLSINRTGLPFAIVLIDVSASMGLEDTYSDSRDQDVAGTLGEANDSERLTRLDLTKAVLTRNSGRFLKRLQSDHNVRIYKFSNTTETVSSSGQSSKQMDLSDSMTSIAELSADGELTAHGPAVRKVLDDFRGTPPAAVILFTDGITTTSEADKLSATLRQLRRPLVPMYTVGIGSDEPAADLHLYDLISDEVAIVDNAITFSAKVKSLGISEPQFSLVLKQKQSFSESPTEEVVASIPIQNSVQRESAIPVEITYVPTVAGEFDFTLEVVAHADESDISNNSETRHVSVRDEKIRVLLADQVPRYEFRYVKNLLERDATIDLKTVLQDADVEHSRQDQTAIEYFPVSYDQLASYDVVIWGDVDPNFVSGAVFENLRRFVDESGGGLIIVAGQQHNPSSYRGTPLEALLPIELDDSQSPPPHEHIGRQFRPELTTEARMGSTVFRLADDDATSTQIWETLPELYWLFEAPRLKDGAIVFAKQAGGRSTIPVIAMQRFGTGKVVFHATDELWRWRWRAGDLYYGRYWIQMIRYLTRSRLIGRSRAADLNSDRLVYKQGDSASLRVQFFDQRLIPEVEDGVVVAYEHPGHQVDSVRLQRSIHNPSLFEGRIDGLIEGGYHAWIAEPAFEGAPPSVSFQVEMPMQELSNRSTDTRELVQVARQTHGRYYSLKDVERLPEEIPSGYAIPLASSVPIPLWNRWEVLVAFVALLTAEWLLRKRYRLI